MDANDKLSQIGDEPQDDDQKLDDQSQNDDQDQDDDKHEPKEGSKRWNEVYWKMKETERNNAKLLDEIANLRTDMEAVREHNKALSESILNVEDKFSESSRPDPSIEPEKYEKWMTEKIKRDIQKSNNPPQDTQPQNQPPQVNPQIAMQEAAMAALYDDYYDVAGEVMKEFKTNDALRIQIMSAVNPPKALYKYYQGKSKDKNDQMNQNLDQGIVEGNNPPPGNNSSTKLTDQERKVAKFLGITEENYIKQKQYIDAKAKKGA